MESHAKGQLQLDLEFLIFPAGKFIHLSHMNFLSANAYAAITQASALRRVPGN